jgi:hypothetical protein
VVPRSVLDADRRRGTLEEVRFSSPDTRGALALDGIPRRLFSEVMRDLDLDLVVSVAQAGGVDPETSASTVEMRAALVAETVELLAIANVRVEELPFADDDPKTAEVAKVLLLARDDEIRDPTILEQLRG